MKGAALADGRLELKRRGTAKVENHAYAVALHMMYNFVRIHKSLRMTPAMTAGVADRLWEIGDNVALIEKVERRAPRKRGPYKERVS